MSSIIKSIIFVLLVCSVIKTASNLVRVDCNNPKCSNTTMNFVCIKNVGSTLLLNESCSTGSTLSVIPEYTAVELLQVVFSCGDRWSQVIYHPSGMIGWVKWTDTESCSLKCTIQDGINEANNGGIIRVAGCEYPENIIINKSVKLLGPNNNIKPFNNTDCINSTIDQHRLTEAQLKSSGHCAMMIQSSNVEISGFQFGPWIRSSICHFGMDIDNVTISNNLISNNFGFGIIGTGGSTHQYNCMIYFGQRNNWQIHHNLISNWYGAKHAAILSAKTRNNQWNIHHNKILNSYHIIGKRGIEIESLSNSTIQYNNIMQMEKWAILLRHGIENVNINMNCFRNNGIGISILGTSNYGIPYITNNINITQNNFIDHKIKSISIKSPYWKPGPIGNVCIEENNITQSIESNYPDDGTIGLALSNKVNNVWSCPGQSPHYPFCIPIGLNSLCNHDLIKIRKNRINSTNINGLRLRGKVATVDIINNTLYGNDNDIGVILKSKDMKYGDFDNNTIINIKNNTIEHWGIGIDNDNTSSLTISYNNILNNDIYGLKSNNNISAECNYWGSATGPTLGNDINGMNIDGIPFLNNYFWDSTVQCVNGLLPPLANCNIFGNCTGNGICQYNCTSNELIDFFTNGNITLNCQSYCNCTNPYIGESCNQIIADCTSFNNCNGNGICEVNGTTSYCDCVDSYFGPYCNETSMLPPLQMANCTFLNNCNGRGICQLNCTMDQLLTNQNGTGSFICLSECLCGIGFGGIDCSMRIANPIILLIFILFPIIIAIIVLIVLCIDYTNRRNERRRILSRNKIQ